MKEIGAEGNRQAQDGIAKLSIVGIGMRSHSGVAARLFEALSTGGDQHPDDLHQRDQDRRHHRRSPDRRSRQPRARSLRPRRRNQRLAILQRVALVARVAGSALHPKTLAVRAAVSGSIPVSGVVLGVRAEHRCAHFRQGITRDSPWRMLSELWPWMRSSECSNRRLAQPALQKLRILSVSTVHRSRMCKSSYRAGSPGNSTWKPCMTNVATATVTPIPTVNPQRA